MYCVIQELSTKRADSFGAYKGIEISTNPFNYMRTIPQYKHFECGERFERPIKKAYKISIHESKRVKGVVTKKQFVVTTVNYYIFATDFFCLGEYHEKIADIAHKLNADMNTIYCLIENKVALLEKYIRDEFMQTEEYAVTQARKALVAEYKTRKSEFAAKHKIDDSEYDYCFDVFGNLLNAEHYERIINGESLQCTFRQMQHLQLEESIPLSQTTQSQQCLLQGGC
jgi:hypothetical protein